MKKAERTEQLIDKLTEQLEEAKAELIRINKPEFELCNSGYTVLLDGNIVSSEFEDSIKFGSMNKKQEAAQRLRFMQYRLNIQFQIAEFLNEGWMLYLDNNNRGKYVIVWCRNSHCYMPQLCLSSQYNAPAFKTKELAEEAIEIQKLYLENLPWE